MKKKSSLTNERFLSFILTFWKINYRNVALFFRGRVFSTFYAILFLLLFCRRSRVCFSSKGFFFSSEFSFQFGIVVYIKLLTLAVIYFYIIFWFCFLNFLPFRRRVRDRDNFRRIMDRSSRFKMKSLLRPRSVSS